MAGTKVGSKLAGQTNKERHGSDYYKRIGAMGGSKGSKDGVVKGFAANHDLAVRAGKLGGTKSRRRAKRD